MSQEVRIGALALVTIALGLWGLKFIQGQNLLARTDTYFAFYENVGGVQIGTPVQVSGVTVGAVSGIDLSDTDRRVMLTLEMERDLPLPKATRAVLVTTSVLGDMAIYLEYDQPCPGSGPDCAADQDTLRGVTRGMIEAILGEGGVDQYVETLNDGLKEVL
ncbi:MAG: MCE family protein, partial [Lewinella sp.]|nr:MCE family protein [Lewinella sp.]